MININDKVVCVSDNWLKPRQIKIFGFKIKLPWKKGRGPKEGDIVRVLDKSYYSDMMLPIIMVSGWEGDWHSEHSFRKTDESFAEETLNNILKKIKEEEKVLQKI